MRKRFAVMRDLHDHLKQGRLGPFELGVYQIIHWQADFKTGVWWGSAPAVHCVAPYGCSLRDVQRAIKKLTRIGFLVPFHTRGKRGNFPVLIHKYEPLSGALRGKRLNAAKSTDWRNPVYEPCAETGTETDTETDTEAAPIQYAVGSTQEKPKTTPRFALPDWVPLGTWNDFLEMRKSLGATPTEKAKTLLVGKLQKLKNSGQDPKAVLEQSTERSWRGVFPIKESLKGKPDAATIERENLALGGFTVH